MSCADNVQKLFKIMRLTKRLNSRCDCGLLRLHASSVACCKAPLFFLLHFELDWRRLLNFDITDSASVSNLSAFRPLVKC